MKQFLEQQIEEQKGYIKDLINNQDYALEDYLDVTKTDEMVSKTNNEDSYLYEKGRYTAFKEILEELNKDKQFIIILDFINGKIYTSEYKEINGIDSEEWIDTFFKFKGINSSYNNCQWMITKNELNIKHF